MCKVTRREEGKGGEGEEEEEEEEEEAGGKNQLWAARKEEEEKTVQVSSLVRSGACFCEDQCFEKGEDREGEIAGAASAGGEG